MDEEQNDNIPTTFLLAAIPEVFILGSTDIMVVCKGGGNVTAAPVKGRQCGWQNKTLRTNILRKRFNLFKYYINKFHYYDFFFKFNIFVKGSYCDYITGYEDYSAVECNAV
jgi:hypothetical protein